MALSAAGAAGLFWRRLILCRRSGRLLSDGIICVGCFLWRRFRYRRRRLDFALSVVGQQPFFGREPDLLLADAAGRGVPRVKLQGVAAAS